MGAVFCAVKLKIKNAKKVTKYGMLKLDMSNYIWYNQGNKTQEDSCSPLWAAAGYQKKKESCNGNMYYNVWGTLYNITRVQMILTGCILGSMLRIGIWHWKKLWPMRQKVTLIRNLILFGIDAAVSFLYIFPRAASVDAPLFVIYRYWHSLIIPGMIIYFFVSLWMAQFDDYME